MRSHPLLHHNPYSRLPTYRQTEVYCTFYSYSPTYLALAALAGLAGARGTTTWMQSHGFIHVQGTLLHRDAPPGDTLVATR